MDDGGILERRSSAAGETAPAAGVVFVRSARARRYRLTLRRDGAAVVTVPVRGSQREAEEFAAGQADWLVRARERQRRRPRAEETWTIGVRVLWRGELVPIRPADGGAGLPAPGFGAGEENRAPAPAIPGPRLTVCLASDVFRVRPTGGDLRPQLEAQFVRRARLELPARAWELAAATGAELKNVGVRNQRSRWGSCSARGTVSLNWRLVQVPEPVRDYIILHELAHLREMNHGPRFWAQVEATCTGWREAERWLKRHAGLVGL